MDKIKALTPTWCAHYQSPTFNETCEAGVLFSTFDGLPLDRRPCFWSSRETCVECPKQKWPTPEELEEEERQINEAVARITKTFPLMEKVKAEHKGESWSGVEACPICNGRLHITHSGYNGHVGAKCETPECVSFQE